MTSLPTAFARNKLGAALLKAGYNPAQERDERGRWSSGGGESWAPDTNPRHADILHRLNSRDFSALKEAVMIPNFHWSKDQFYSSIDRSDRMKEILAGTLRENISAEGIKLNAPEYHPKYLFHGTSDKYLNDILANGLRAGTYLSPEVGLANDEAGFTVDGDPYADGVSARFARAEGVGGKRAILLLRYSSLANNTFKEDPGYVSGGSDQYAVIARDPIPPSAIARVIRTDEDFKSLLPLAREQVRGGNFAKARQIVFKALTKTFDPNQPRNEDGEWSKTGSSGFSAGGVSAKAVKEALKAKHIRAAVSQAYGNLKSNSKDIIATVAATVLAQGTSAGGVSDMETDALKQSLLHLANNMGVTTAQARDHVVGTLKKLRELRMKDLSKAKDDPVIKRIDEAIARLERLDLEADEVVKQKRRVNDFRTRISNIKARLSKAVR